MYVGMELDNHIVVDAETNIRMHGTWIHFGCQDFVLLELEYISFSGFSSPVQYLLVFALEAGQRSLLLCQL